MSARLTWGRPFSAPRNAADDLLIDRRTEPGTRAMQLLGAGSPERDAYSAIGVPKRTWFEWKAKGRDAHDADDTTPKVRPYREFYERLQVAQAEGRASLVVNTRRAGIPHDEEETVVESKPVIVKTYNENGKVVSERVEMHDHRAVTDTSPGAIARAGPSAYTCLAD